MEIEEVTDLDMAFGTTKYLPNYSDVPDDFKGRNKWTDLFDHIFYKGSEGITVGLKDGVDGNKAFRWIRAHMASFEPKHEHKTAGVAFKMSQWFGDWTVDKIGKDK